MIGFRSSTEAMHLDGALLRSTRTSRNSQSLIGAVSHQWPPKAISTVLSVKCLMFQAGSRRAGNRQDDAGDAARGHIKKGPIGHEDRPAALVSRGRTARASATVWMSRYPDRAGCLLRNRTSMIPALFHTAAALSGGWADFRRPVLGEMVDNSGDRVPDEQQFLSTGNRYGRILASHAARRADVGAA